MTAAQAYNLRRRLILGLFAVIGTLVACYMYFVSVSVIHVVLQKETEQSIGKLSAKVGALESDYLSKRNSITENLALSEGYVVVTGATFASRQTLLTSAASVPSGF